METCILNGQKLYFHIAKHNATYGDKNGHF